MAGIALINQVNHHRHRHYQFHHQHHHHRHHQYHHHRHLQHHDRDVIIVTGGAPLPGEAGAWVGRFQKGKWTIILKIMMMMMMMNKMKLW